MFPIIVPTDQPYALIVEGGQIMEGLRALWKNASVVCNFCYC